jgi:hypothetical protein
MEMSHKGKTLDSIAPKHLTVPFISVADPDPKLFAASGKKHSGSGQPGPGRKMKQNFSDKNHSISTKCTLKIYRTKRLVYIPKNLYIVISEIKCNFTVQLSLS